MIVAWAAPALPQDAKVVFERPYDPDGPGAARNKVILEGGYVAGMVGGAYQDGFHARINGAAVDGQEGWALSGGLKAGYIFPTTFGEPWKWIAEFDGYYVGQFRGGLEDGGSYSHDTGALMLNLLALYNLEDWVAWPYLGAGVGAAIDGVSATGEGGESSGTVARFALQPVVGLWWQLSDQVFLRTEYKFLCVANQDIEEYREGPRGHHVFHMGLGWNF